MIISPDEESFQCSPCIEFGVSYLNTASNNSSSNNNGKNHYDLSIRIQSKNPEACRNLCYEQQGCNFWTLDVAKNICHLIQKRGINSSSSSSHDFVSGVKVCEDWRAFKHPLNGKKSVYITILLSSFCKVIYRVLGSNAQNLSENSPLKVDSKPLVNVLHSGGDRSVLQGLPATFGTKIDRDFQVFNKNNLIS